MIRKNFFGSCLACACWMALATHIQAQNTTAASFDAIPGEMVYVHQNSNLLFTGESFYYKLYCRNQASAGLSSLSKIAYLTLLDESMRPVLRHKIRLENGQAQGDFLIPVTVPTGSYKVLAYTQWIKNWDAEAVFLSDLAIINPYQTLPGRHLEKPAPDSLVPNASNGRRVTSGDMAPSNGNGINMITLTLSKAQFGKRERVDLELKAGQMASRGGSYSLSVRRISQIASPMAITALLDSKKPRPKRKRIVAADDKMAIPELRGELLTGSVTATGQQNVQGLPVALSLSGDDFLFDIARTNAQGRFFYNMDQEYQQNQGILQVIGGGDAYEISLDPEDLPQLPKLNFFEFRIGEALRDQIRKQSIQNQVENAYAEVKSDTLLRTETALPFYRKFQFQYTLDDYTRFNTIEETLVEIVDQVWLTKNSGGEPMFQVRPFDGYLDGIGMPPMVFMDGLFIQNHADIVGFPAKRIKNIYFSRDRYQIGSNVFQGILAFETFPSDFADSFYREFIKTETLFKPEPRKAYFTQRYPPGQENPRIPDFRNQLYWEPNLQLAGEENTVHWYTSDLEGTYEIRVEGYTPSGQPVSLSKSFVVE